MSTEANSDDGARPGVFLKVERTEDGYIETDLAGKRTQYFRHTSPETIELKNLKAFRSINLRTGAAKYYVTAKTAAAYRAVGTEKAYPVRDVTLRSTLAPGRAVFTSRYGVKGHPYSTTLDIGLSDTALTEIVAECRSAPSVRVLDVQLEESSFYGTHPECDYEFPHSGYERFRLLPFWSDQLISRETKGSLEFVVVEWSFDVATVTVCPESRHSVLEQGIEMPRSSVTIDGPVLVYRQPSPGDGDHDKAFGRMEDQLARLLASIDSLRVPLYLIGICAAAAALLLAL